MLYTIVLLFCQAQSQPQLRLDWNSFSPTRPTTHPGIDLYWPQTIILSMYIDATHHLEAYLMFIPSPLLGQAKFGYQWNVLEIAWIC